MFLIYTGLNRFSDNVEKDKIKNLDKNFKNLDKIKNITNYFVKNLDNKLSIDLCASLMNDYWNIKKKLSKKVTNSFINEIYKSFVIIYV